ncbi:uncharacterized protein LOC107471400 [Arachis duranensis]|uniref:Uncharacterized protein LOC107471400 n=1 Tax=Arachis duranensis TaxID=130453 RepID=A0A6P4BQX0_ARADU|nr:uncharacterized protein LOC107471400 [Arachis duranensis]
MASNNPFIVVLLYPDCRMRNSDKGVPFECQDPILFRTQHVETLSDLKSLILSKVGGTQARKIGRVAYRLLAPMGNRIFRFRLFRLHGDEHVRLMFDIHGRIMCEQVMELSAEVGYGGSGSSIHEMYVQDDRPLAPPPIHVAIPEHKGEEGEEKSDEDYVADSESSDDGDKDEFVPETPEEAVPSHYHSLHLDVMHERNPVSDSCGVDYNLDGGVEFRVGHRFRSREAVLQGMKNYSIRRSAEYRVIESDRLKYHVQCRQADSGCQWSPVSPFVGISDTVQSVCQYPGLARCGVGKLSLQTLIQKGVDGEAEGHCTDLRFVKSRTTRCRSCFKHCRAISPAPYVTYASNRTTKDTS